MIPAIFTLLVLTTIGAVLFPLVYAFIPWWSTRAGRAAMTLGAALAVVLVLTVLRNVVGVDFPLWVVLAAYAVLCAGVWTQLLVLISYIRRHRPQSDRERETAR